MNNLNLTPTPYPHTSPHSTLPCLAPGYSCKISPQPIPSDLAPPLPDLTSAHLLLTLSQLAPPLSNLTQPTRPDLACTPVRFHPSPPPPDLNPPFPTPVRSHPSPSLPDFAPPFPDLIPGPPPLGRYQ